VIADTPVPEKLFKFGLLSAVSPHTHSQKHNIHTHTHTNIVSASQNSALFSLQLRLFLFYVGVSPTMQHWWNIYKTPNRQIYLEGKNLDRKRQNVPPGLSELEAIKKHHLLSII